MPELATRSRDNPEFARVLEVRALGEDEAFAFDIVPDVAEAAAIARLLGAQAVRKMRLAGTLAPEGRGWRLDARLGATAVQSCVVTLEPVSTRIDETVRRRYEAGAAPRRDVTVAASGDEDDVEPLGERIDLGLVAIEALALALPDYPRKPGAVFPGTIAGPAGATGDSPVEIRPFAPLAALRDKLGGGS